MCVNDRETVEKLKNRDIREREYMHVANSKGSNDREMRMGIWEDSKNKVPILCL